MKVANILILQGLWLPHIIALEEESQTSVTVTHWVDVIVQRLARLNPRAIIPTESGQIGINPPGAEPTIANIEGHTKYLTLDGGSTKWIGPDPSYISIKTTTTTDSAGQTAVATVTKGVEASKNADGSLDILLSPAIIEKLQGIHAEVVPCAAKRRRSHLGRRGGPACGVADFVQRVGADAELQDTFAQPMNDQVSELCYKIVCTSAFVLYHILTAVFCKGLGR